MPTINRVKNAIKVKNIAQVFENLKIRNSLTARYFNGQLSYLMGDSEVDAGEIDKKYPVTLISNSDGKHLDSRQI